MQTHYYSYADSKKFSHQARMRRVENLARWLDAKWKVPGTEFKIGLDGTLGLVPGIGDTLATAMALYIIYEAHHMGAPTHIKARMAWNVFFDWLIGLIPVFGDILDFANKANIKNINLLRKHFG